MHNHHLSWGWYVVDMVMVSHPDMTMMVTMMDAMMVVTAMMMVGDVMH